MRIVNLVVIAFGVLPIFVAAARSAQPDSAFQASDLPSLDLANVGDFWKDDTSIVREDSPGGNFSREKAYLRSLGYRGKNKGVQVTVFRSEEDAVKAMEALRGDVASVILPGDATAWNQHDVRFAHAHAVTVPWDASSFGGLKWWFTFRAIPNEIYVNCRNTIVRVHCYQPPFDESKALLKKTAAVVAHRVAEKCGITVELRFRKKTPAFAVNKSILVEAWFVNRTDKPQVYRGGLELTQAKAGCQITLMAEGRKKAWSAPADAAPAFYNHNDIEVPARGQTLIGEWDLSKLVYTEGSPWRSGTKYEIPFADIARPGQYRVCWWDGVFQLGTPLRSEPVDFEIVQATKPSTANPPQNSRGQG
jgi:hypothetical protein